MDVDFLFWLNHGSGWALHLDSQSRGCKTEISGGEDRHSLIVNSFQFSLLHAVTKSISELFNLALYALLRWELKYFAAPCEARMKYLRV